MRQVLYQLWMADQPDFNWLTRVTSEQEGYGLRMRYARLTCKGCGQLWMDDVFAEGFDSHIRIRVKKGRNIFMTEDHFLCVTEEMRDRLIDGGVGGFEHKPLQETMWHVLRVTERRRFDQTVYGTERHARRCAVCGRVGEYGTVNLLRQIEAPEKELALFSTDRERGQGGYDLFVTEAMLRFMKEAGVKGATCRRLLSDEEAREAQERRVTEPGWKPKGSMVVL